MIKTACLNYNPFKFIKILCECTLRLIVTLNLIKNQGQGSLFSSLTTIPVKYCGFRDSVSSVGVVFFTSFQVVIYSEISKISKEWMS